MGQAMHARPRMILGLIARRSVARARWFGWSLGHAQCRFLGRFLGRLRGRFLLRSLGRSLGRLLGPHLAGVCLALSLSACGLLDVFDSEPALPGERLSLRTAQDEREAQLVREQPLPPAQAVAAWTQTNANASHNGGHIAGPTAYELAWTADAGEGSDDGARIISAPIVAEDTVFTLDAAAQVSAFDAGSGADRWRVNLAPEGEDGEEGFGGGLAYEGGRIFATTGFGEVVALEASSGTELWRQAFGAPFRSAPAVSGGLVLAVTRDNRAFALTASNGQVRWRLPGVTAEAGVLGGASPALGRGLAAVPFASGELIAAAVGDGRRLWSAVLSGGRRGLARSSISDVTGDPLILGNFVIAGNQSGRVVAIEGRRGARVWTRSFGSQGPIWGAGDTVFLVTDDAILTRLSARDGSTLWQVPLPAFDDPEDREGPITYSGPVVVSGRVLITTSDGAMAVFDALTGDFLFDVDLSEGTRTGPVVVGNTVFVLADDGRLHAFR